MNESNAAISAWLVSELIRQIESLWESAQNPNPDVLLEAAGIALPADVAKVLATDQWHRWHACERLAAEDYFARHPAVGADAEAALLLVYGEFLVREELGEEPSPGEYLTRFPQCTRALCRQLDFHAAVEEPDSTVSASEKATGERMATPPFSTDATALPPPDSARSSATGPAEAGTPTSLGSPGANDAHLTGTGPAEAGTPTRSGLPDPNDARLAASGPQADPALIGRYRIIRRLGQGGFGRVYLAHDDELDRPVAVKVPNVEAVAGHQDVERYLAEARMVAKLDHPQIVPVYDVGRTDDCLCYVVSKFVEGSDLAERMRQGRLAFRESAELVAAVALALHHAHARGLVHRDVKPANILLDVADRPSVADFGLALQDEDYGKGARFAGTPSYMSPEQAKGEGHRVDGRSDVFSLGVVFYELLTGRKPFLGGTPTEIMEAIVRFEEPPPRLVDDTIPHELERICRKMLAKRASERYSTAGDLADDLHHFLRSDTSALDPAADLAPKALAPGAPFVATATAATARSDSDAEPVVKVVPKGLRAFDQNDAAFFLELLPGPRDRDGLPDSLRYWKTRVETTDPDITFKVGLIYGPSGCGKTSLVKAGLLPRLAKHVLPVYLEATPDETEARLLKAVRKVRPDLTAGLGLIETLAALRRGKSLRSGQKVVFLLDQFEQWLHGKPGQENTELVDALRQCDGAHLQSIVMVRDDFWMATTRFMRQLEIDLVPDQNIAAVDLFDPEHAKNVLGAFGAAYGKLPERERNRTPEQDAFLDQAVSELTQEGKVISVRLALFAETVKGKPWTPAALRQVGGTEGVGVTFLEETFSSPQADPRHRLHQKAAQAVLKALLPETGTDIKGQMRAEAELRAASGYADRPRDFADLIRILDPELRLITPTDPEGSSSEEQAALPRGKYFQLAHDYLVHSLRQWLTRKQRETRRGRAELRLAERAALWNAKPQNRHLPSIVEWANIRVLTKKANWTQPEQRMMKRAGRMHGLRTLGAAAALILAVLIGLETHRRVTLANEQTIAAGLVEQVVRANIAQVPGIVNAMKRSRRLVDPALRDVAGRSSERSTERLHASLALLPVDGGQVDYLYDRLLDADADAFPILRDALEPHRASLIPKLWSAPESARPGDARLLPATSALALYDPQDARWAKVAGNAAEAVVQVNAIYLRSWLDALRPVRGKLTPPLAAIFRNKDRSESERTQATVILADYASDDAKQIADLLMDSGPKPYAAFFAIAKGHAETMMPLFQAEIAKGLTPTWGDAPPDPSWIKPDLVLVGKIEGADGIVAERFAFCQSMPLEELKRVCEGLRSSGFRPTRIRPYADGPVVRAAAVWARDGRDWFLSSGLTAAEARQRDQDRQAMGYLPTDVAGCLTAGADGKPSDVYAVLWVKRARSEERARMYAGALMDEHRVAQNQLRKEGFVPASLQTVLGPDGKTRFSGVWTSSDAAGDLSWDQTESALAASIASRPYAVPADLSPSASEAMLPSAERARLALEAAERNVTGKPDDTAAHLARALALCQAGEWRKALDQLDALAAKPPIAADVYQFRARAHAHLKHKDEALSDLEKYRQSDAPETLKLFTAVVVTAQLGVEETPATDALENAVKSRPDDAGLFYVAACAYSLASVPVSARNKARGSAYVEKAAALLARAISAGYSNYAHLLADFDLDPIRGSPAYAIAVAPGQLDRRYAEAWSAAPGREAAAVYRIDPEAQRRRCRELEAEGYRPLAISTARTPPGGPLVTASVWHRPLVTERARDELAKRQARSAIALVRMGRSAEIWPLLRHSLDPRIRSFIINWLNPLGADPKPIAVELARLNSSAALASGPPRPAERGVGGRSPGDGSSAQLMNAILFNPETSARRALILALGNYRPTDLTAADREPLVAALLDLYRNDPDAGIHGAAEWTIGQWNEQARLVPLDAELRRLGDKDRRRRWYVNGKGQTFAVIDGPVEFRMGSPPFEPGQIAAEELPHRRIIPRRFAIAAKEVTVEEYHEFVKENPGLDHASNDQYSPDPKGPMNGVSWYHAVAYCNWLSRKENLPECYEPNPRGQYAQEMKIRADALRRTGYRLPTEAEWEYTCRAGAGTSRYYGGNVDLLGRYAWYLATSSDRARPCGSLLPNDLGLFDILGNVGEWCQDQTLSYRPDRAGVIVDDLNIQENLQAENVQADRLQRGGAFVDRPVSVRSASRTGDLPTDFFISYGFRLARTYD